jgi:D-glycero-beta-D-manno-heptose 1-phosphate adenylyltransferase
MRSFEEKFVPFSKLETLSKKLHDQKSKIVTTNGCFDILHLGHVQYLKEAKALGTVLVCGINSDASVKKLKGPNRPLNSEQVRAQIIAALEAVDYVTIFGEDTPEKFLSLVKPNIHVKGGDYSGKDLPERKVVEANGGKIALLKFVEGYSTTQLLKDLKK